MKTKALLPVLIFICLASSAQWTQQESNTSFNLNNIHFLNDSVGFIVGNSGVFLKTVNRGQDWNLSVINSTDDLKAVFAIDEDTLYAGGDVLYKSTDGGLNWNTIYNQHNILEIKFFSPARGFIKTMYQYECYPSAFRDQMRFMQTNDWGNTWQNCIELPLALDDGYMEVVSADTGYFFGNLIFYEYHCASIIASNIYKTTNGGMLWDGVNMFSYSGQNKDASFVNAWEGYLLYAENGLKLYKINNGGSDFDFISEITGNSVGNLVFPTLYEGYYTYAGKIMKSTSGGFYWEEDYSGDVNLTDLIITENNEAYAVGKSGLILHQKLNPVTEPDAVYLIDCSTASLSFPRINIGEDSTLSFTLSATGNKDITVDIVAPPDFMVRTEGGQFVEQINDLVIPASHDTLISVFFHASEYKNYLDTLMIMNNSMNQPLIRVPVSGKGVCFLPAVIQADTAFCYDSVWVRNNVLVQESRQMVFCPGTTVAFEGAFRMEVNGSLQAIGNEFDSIRFVSQSAGTKWAGMIIAGDNPSDSVILQYCRFENSECNYLSDTSYGGAMKITGNRNTEVRNSFISNCEATVYGGGIYCTSPGFVICDSRISSCSALKGGGLYYKASRAKAISGCTIDNCSVTDYGNGYGGGIYCESDADSVILNCTVTDCFADMGGGLYLRGNNYSAHDCLVSDCNGLYSGGGIFAGQSETSTIEGMKIQGCIAGAGAGIFFFSSANVDLLNCEISGCEAEEGGGICISGYGNVLVKNCTISGNKVTGGKGAGISLYFASPRIMDNRICDNHASSGSGAGIHSYGGAPTITGNIICRNTADSDGAGIYIDANQTEDTIQIRQNLIYDNLANSGRGAGMFLLSTNCNIFQNTITSNQSLIYSGDGIYCSLTANIRMIGNILYDNGDNEFFTIDASNTVLEYNDIKGGWTGSGEGNIDLDPLFYGLDAYPWNIWNPDFSIRPESPCIDNSIPDTTGLLIPAKDLAGNPRYTGNRLDIGAYENNFSFQTIDTGFCLGQDLELEVIPIYPGPYQDITWTFNGTPVAGVDSTVLVIENPTPADEGYYNCTLQSQESDLFSRTIYLYNKGNPPEAQIQPAGAILNPGDEYSMSFSVYSTDHYIHYQWYKNDTVLEGQNDQVLDIYDFSKEQQGAYRCWVETSCGGLFSEEALILINSAGIQEFEESGFRIYPNPALQLLTIDNRHSISAPTPSLPLQGEGDREGAADRQQSLSITINNVFGQLLLQLDNVQSFPYQIDISVLPPGLYFIRIEDKDGHSGSVKFIKAAN